MQGLGRDKDEERSDRATEKAPWAQEAILTGGAGWAAESGGLLQEISSRLAQRILTSKITKRNMARRITEATAKIKQAKRVCEIFLP